MTLTEIQDKLVKEIGYETLEDYIYELINNGSFYTAERILKYINELSIRVQQEQQKLIAEKLGVIAKESIINENNIIR